MKKTIAWFVMLAVLTGIGGVCFAQYDPAGASADDTQALTDDFGKIDDSEDTEGIEDSQPPEGITKEHEKLAGQIKKDPAAYEQNLQDKKWLKENHQVVWILCKDRRWMNRHRHIAEIIYLNNKFWYSFPKIAFLIAANVAFFNAYPEIAEKVYVHDRWFVKHPYIAHWIFGNHLFFEKHPKFVERYYRHHRWIEKHPRIVKVAYRNKYVLNHYPKYHANASAYRTKRAAAAKVSAGKARSGKPAYASRAGGGFDKRTKTSKRGK